MGIVRRLTCKCDLIEKGNIRTFKDVLLFKIVYYNGQARFRLLTICYSVKSLWCLTDVSLSPIISHFVTSKLLSVQVV